MCDNARGVIQAEIEKTREKLTDLENVLRFLDGAKVVPISTRSTPTISPREFEGMEIAPATEKLLHIVNKPLGWDEIIKYLLQGNCTKMSKDPSRHPRQVKTTIRMNSKGKPWHQFRADWDNGLVYLRIWDRERVET